MTPSTAEKQLLKVMDDGLYDPVLEDGPFAIYACFDHQYVLNLLPFHLRHALYATLTRACAILVVRRGKDEADFHYILEPTSIKATWDSAIATLDKPSVTAAKA